MSQTKLRIGITLGDINGIGPELVLKAFQNHDFRNICIPILYGSSRVLNIYKKQLQIDKFFYTVVPNPEAAKAGTLNLIECMPDVERVEIGVASPIGGQCALMALDRALDDALHQKIDALLTLPVDKATVKLYKQDFRGHTEMLAKHFGVPENLMMMVSEEMRVALVTNHLPIKEVATAITAGKIVQKTKLFLESLRTDFSLSKPKIAILGLNPHAGDEGLIGTEEKNIIIPAVQQLQREGHIVMGPYSPDGFFSSNMFKQFDGVLAMYHDQGLIPFKLYAGMSGVNFTAGLPIVRTSPDHGVAYDIAGRGIADESSFRTALYLTVDAHRRRAENLHLKANALHVEKRQVSREEAESTASFEEI